MSIEFWRDLTKQGILALLLVLQTFWISQKLERLTDAIVELKIEMRAHTCVCTGQRK